MQDPIAERRLLYAVKGSSERKVLVIRIGRPYWLRADVAACPIEWEGLFGPLPDVQGSDLLQALHLAADVDPWLRDLGGKYDFFFLDGDPYHDTEEARPDTPA